MWRLIASLLLAACTASPDAFELTYGRAFNGNSSLEGWPIEQDDTDYVGLGLTWHLKPREVIITPVSQEADMFNVQDPPAVPVEEVPVEAAAAIDPSDVADVLDRFDAFGWPTQIVLVIALVALAWIFRERIRRLFPGGNGPAKS